MAICAATPANPPPIVVTVRKPRRQRPQPKGKNASSQHASQDHGAAGPDLSPEELQRRAAAADGLWRELVRWVTGNGVERHQRGGCIGGGGEGHAGELAQIAGAPGVS